MPSRDLAATEGNNHTNDNPAPTNIEGNNQELKNPMSSVIEGKNDRNRNSAYKPIECMLLSHDRDDVSKPTDRTILDRNRNHDRESILKLKNDTISYAQNAALIGSTNKSNKQNEKWYIDSGAMEHMCSKLDWFETYRETSPSPI